MIRTLLILLCAALPAISARLTATTVPQEDRPGQTCELVVRGGLVVDGSGGAARQLDIAVCEGRICLLGDLPEDLAAAETIDASGLVIAPGFVDVHAHADLAAARRGDARNFVAMGVTTIVTGNCGSHRLGLEAHLAEVEKNGIAINYASLVGHGTVRSEVLGGANRAPTAEELQRMCALVEQEMRAGAFGMSTGLIYVPGTYAETDEIVALAEVVAKHGGVYASHVRNEGDHGLDAIREALEIGERAGLPVHVSHLKASGKPNWGNGERIVALLREARANGKQVTGDQYAYTASSTSLDVLFPSAALSEGRRAFAERLENEPAFRAEMHQALLAGIERSGFGDLHYAQIASSPGHREYQGLRLSEAAERMSGDRSPEAQANAAIALMIASKGSRVGMVYHKMTEDDVETILREPFVAVASDSGIRLYDTAERPHPRGAGNNPRVLGRYVREREVLPLELAIHKMTRLPATVFGLTDRGEIAIGKHADLVVFDAATITDRATYEDPLAAPEGIRYVFVNGTAVVRDGERTDARPGMVLRHTSSAARDDR